MADHRVEKPADVVSEGDIVDAKIIAIDNDNKKVSLSIRAVLEDAAAPEAEDVDEAPVEE